MDKLKIVWKDSYRIFPVSLSDLCEILGFKGKSNKYNPLYRDKALFNNSNFIRGNESLFFTR